MGNIGGMESAKRRGGKEKEQTEKKWERLVDEELAGLQGRMMRSKVVRRGSIRGLGQTMQIRDTIRGRQRGNVIQD